MKGGKRASKATLRSKTDNLAFAVDIAVLVRPAYRAAFSKYHRVAADHSSDAQVEHVVDCIAREVAEDCFVAAVAQALKKETHLVDGDPPERESMWLPFEEERELLRGALATVGVALLHWMISPNASIPPDLPVEARTSLLNIWESGVATGPHVVSSAFAAGFTGAGLPTVMNKSKRNRRTP